MGADHGHDIVQRHQLQAGHGFELAVVDMGNLAAHHGRSGEGGDLQAVHPHIDAVLRSAIDLVRRVQALHGLADQLEVLVGLERDVLGSGQFRGRRGERTVRQFAAAMRVIDHLAAFGPQAGRIDFPLLRRRLHHHGAAGGADLAQRHIEAADRSRTAGGHAMRARAAIHRIDRGGGQGRHIGEIDIQLVRQQLGE